MTQFERERARSPKVAALEVGQQVERVYQGNCYVVTVKEDGYFMQMYKGESPDPKALKSAERYPSLYSTVTDITGTSEYKREGGETTRKMSNWSAPKFWKLK